MMSTRRLRSIRNLPRQLNKQPDIADPGAPMMKIIVRDLETIVTAAVLAGGQGRITGISSTGAPIAPLIVLVVSRQLDNAVCLS
jgi:hypothetical protein